MGYDIRFDSRSGFPFTDGSMGKNVIIFEADMSPSGHIDNENKDILILVETPTQGLDCIKIYDMKKIGLKGIVKSFSVALIPIDTNDI